MADHLEERSTLLAPSSSPMTSLTTSLSPSTSKTIIQEPLPERAESPRDASLQPSPVQRMISACAGSLLTSLLVTPLDVVKTRLQSQTVIATPTCAAPFSFTSNASAYEKLCTCCREVFFAPDQARSTVTGSATSGIRQNIANVVVGGIAKRCGPSIIQQHQEGTIVGMKASKAQQQRLEQLAANCIENNHAIKAAQERYFHGTWDGVKKIVRHEGVSSLWRGLSPTVAMSIPATVIYFVGYDYLKDVLSERMNGSTSGARQGGKTYLVEYQGTLAPLAAGGFARTVAATVISPLELFRTRMQSVHTETKGNSGLFRGVFQGVVTMVQQEGVLSLWRGLAPTLWRDVPFSAIYWVGYENIKRRLVTWDSRHSKPSLNEFEVAFASGALSGMIAAVLTTPFDVAKTRRQVDLNQPVHTRMIDLMRAIVREEGYRGLWRGLTARVAKVAPSCAIMISSYEIGKKALSEHWWGIGTSSSGGPSSSLPPSSSTSTSRSSDDRMVLMRDMQTSALTRLAPTTASTSL
ncbi:hypothetical protein BG006_001876 [Podila minutissima]|uniref:Mitochondrial carrier protein n=1 Tax=Podila minutissima TaxID=64525 RepID=A0A9P5SU40_9FUNG|nr:hypothetical protein BG006_001876 [Podila minutissima]